MMRRTLSIRAVAAALWLAAAIMAAAPALALDLAIPGSQPSAQGIQVPGPTMLDLQTQTAIQERQNFQLRQQINRENDRYMNLQPMPRPDMPTVQPTCQRDVNGNRQTRGCR